MREELDDRDHPQLSIRRRAGLVPADRNWLDDERPEPSEESRARRALGSIHPERAYFGSRISGRNELTSRSEARRTTAWVRH
jgi:hypothetical protein